MGGRERETGMTFSRSTALLLAAGLAAVPLVLHAQDAPPADSNTIVVTEQIERPGRADVHSQALDIAVSGNVQVAPLARWEIPLCAGIGGLTTDTAALMIDRIREHARFVGLQVAEDGCEPNFIVAFVDDGVATLNRLIDNNPARFQYLNSGEKREMLEPGPVHVWTDVQPANRDGVPIRRGRNLVDPPITGGWMSHSLIYTSNRNDIVSVMVLFDRAAVLDMTLVQLADYATMRGLAQTRAPDEVSVDSILGLFHPVDENGDTRANGLTDFDRAYLSAVYEGIPNMPAGVRLGRVAAELRDIEEDPEQ